MGLYTIQTITKSCHDKGWWGDKIPERSIERKRRRYSSLINGLVHSLETAVDTLPF